MTVFGAVDLTKAILDAWEGNSLDAVFQSYWNYRDVSVFPVLHEIEAMPGQPFPYCVYAQERDAVSARMSGDRRSNYEQRSFPFEFHVYATRTNAMSAKEIAYTLSRRIIDVFGGGQEAPFLQLDLDNACHVRTQLQNEFGIRTGDNEYQWSIVYEFLLDLSVRSTAL